MRLRDFYDVNATRSMIYANVLNAAQHLQPLQNARHSLELTDVHYIDPEQRSIKERKKAVLEGTSLYRRLRGTWVLKDKDGNVVDKRTQTVAQVPHMTDAGTFVHNGTEYTVSNQLRMRPGIYTRQKENGEIESHANIIPGKGVSHRYFLNPDKGIFYMRVGQAKIPLMPLLRTLGASDKQLREAWGNEIFASNYKEDTTGAFNKLFSRLVKNIRPDEAGKDRRELLSAAIRRMEVDPDVVEKTLGQRFQNLDLDPILTTTKKLLAVSRGEQDVDDRDHLAFQTVHGPEDLFAERIAKDADRIQKQLLFKSSVQGSLKSMPTNALSKQLHGLILSSGLANSLEEINTGEIFDKLSKVTRLGAGGIPSLDSIPDEARAVQPSHMGFMDPVRTPESYRSGVDTFFARTAKKGDDGKVYAPFRDARTGETRLLSSQDVANKAISFPQEIRPGQKHVAAMVNGRLRRIRRNDIELLVPHFEDAMSPLGNLVPMKSAIKGQRAIMGSRYTVQALPLTHAEAPLVQSGVPGSEDRSFEEEYGKYLGAIHADKDGFVRAVTPDSITVQYGDGSSQTHELYQNFPHSRKTFLSQTPLVQQGQRIKAGDVLAKSNYTDNKGTAAMGLNARVAFVPWHGTNYEDAWVISESFAKRMQSEHMYQHSIDFDEGYKKGKSDFVSLFPSTFNRRQMDTIDDNGVVKPGTVVNYDDPLILTAKPRAVGEHKVHRKGQPSYADASERWTHHTPGVVTDIVHTDKGAAVLVKSLMPMQEGDKFCYDEHTQVLTQRGWLYFRELQAGDRVASLSPSGELEYVLPAAIYRFPHTGRMYRLQTTQVDLCVTDNHRLYAKPRYGSEYRLIEAKELAGKRYRLKNNATWAGQDPEFVEIPGYDVRCGRGGVATKTVSAIRVPTKVYAMLLGMYLSEGSGVCTKNGTYGLDIHQVKAAGRAQMRAALEHAGIHFNLTPSRARIFSKHLQRHFAQFGKCADKFIPDEVFEWSADTLRILYRWLMWGDGGETGTGHNYTTTSKRLANDMQRLCLHIGLAAKIDYTPPSVQEICGKICHCKSCYTVRIYRRKTHPEINHGHVKSQNGQREQWSFYHGEVCCVTLPRNHVLYVRRNGKPVWCGNSDRFGAKGVVGKILPDDKMPVMPDGGPAEVAQNPLGIISRGNPAVIIETALGKIAAKTGKPYKVQDFENIEDLTEFALGELRKHGMKDLEHVVDPETQRKIPALTGNRFFMKLHHTAESKGQGRGTGGYTSMGEPAKGGEQGAKRMSLLDLNAVLSHGAPHVLQDAGLIRGQNVPEFWMAFLQGHTPPKPKVPMIYQRFVNELKAAGINVVPDGQRLNIMAMTDSDVKRLAGDRAVQSGETVRFDNGLKPVTGGLFDAKITGGHGGDRWSYIPLHEPMLNPVMEEPARKLLGLTEKKFLDVLAGREEFRGKTGPQAIQSALKDINVPQELVKAAVEAKGSKRSERDAAVRKLGYLKSCQKLGIHPGDWVMTRVPVLPPRFRPVSIMENTGSPLVADANYLYRELIDANGNLKSLSKQVSDVGDERLGVYNAYKALVGLTDPTHPKLVEKNVQGLLKSIFGPSPKLGMLQRRLISSTTDLVGRATVVPDPDLDMDHVGLPESRAWDVYKNFVVRRLKRNGLPIAEAIRNVADRTPLARKELVSAMEERPIIINRAPVLHRFGIMAFWPKLVKGDVLKVSPIVVGGFNMDFDGDAVQYHVPVAKAAVDEAVARMLPSVNLLSPADLKSPVHKAGQEYIGGVYAGTRAPNPKSRPHRFVDRKSAIAAYKRGDISIDTPVEIME